MPLRTILALILLSICACQHAPIKTTTIEKRSSHVIESYAVEITPDLTGRTISGTTTLTLRKNPLFSKFSIPLHGLFVDSVRVDGIATALLGSNDTLIVPLASADRPGEMKIAIDYHGAPTRGIVFGSRYVYTTFSTWNWMIADEDPGVKSTFELTLLAPKGFKVVASGEEVSARAEKNGLVRHVWKQSRPYSSYLFGFAAGRFSEAFVKRKDSTLRFLGATERSAALHVKFRDTPRMMDFYREKSGTSLSNTYTQVLVPGDEAQEVSTYSVLGKDAVDPILKDPQEDWASAHELAHQWWGNLITCESWEHFWLNEGITVFMVAAYKEHRWGRAAYETELDRIRKRYRRAIDAKLDVPLTYAGEYPSLQLKRAIVYNKGALFVDALRTALGEEPFWTGIREYTRANIGKSVNSRTFQAAMEKSAGRSLEEIFSKWVY